MAPISSLRPCSRRHVLQATAAASALLAAPTLRAQVQSAVLQIVGPWEIVGLAPASSGYVFTRMQIAETLLDAQDDGQPQAGLATRWQVSEDGLSWIFTLRSTARFHDGTRVTAAAVVDCLKRACVAPALLSVAPIARIKTLDAGRLEIGLSRPFAGLLTLLAHSSTLILAPSSYDASGAVRRIVASGPYRVQTLTPPQQLQAQAFEDYDGPRPAIERVRYQVAGRAETRALMAESGQADLAFGLDPASLARLRKRPQLKIASVTLPRSVILKLNAGLPSLHDVRVRQALSLAIDRAGIAQALLRDPEMAATQLFSPSLKAWNDPSLPPLRHDPAAAAELLRQAGWQRAGDGLRDAQGQPLKLQLLTFPDRPELPIIAAALQEQWRQAGIAVQVQVGNSGDVPLAHRAGSLQLALASRNYGMVPDPTGTLIQDFGPEGGDWGAMGWRDAQMQTALQGLTRGAASPKQQAEWRHQISAILQQQLPVIPVCWYRQQVALSRRVQGVSLDPLERSYRLTQMSWQA